MDAVVPFKDDDRKRKIEPSKKKGSTKKGKGTAVWNPNKTTKEPSWRVGKDLDKVRAIITRISPGPSGYWKDNAEDVYELIQICYNNVQVDTYSEMEHICLPYDRKYIQKIHDDMITSGVYKARLPDNKGGPSKQAQFIKAIHDDTKKSFDNVRQKVADTNQWDIDCVLKWSDLYQDKFQDIRRWFFTIAICYPKLTLRQIFDKGQREGRTAIEVKSHMMSKPKLYLERLECAQLLRELEIFLEDENNINTDSKNDDVKKGYAFFPNYSVDDTTLWDRSEKTNDEKMTEREKIIKKRLWNIGKLSRVQWVLCDGKTIKNFDHMPSDFEFGVYIMEYLDKNPDLFKIAPRINSAKRYDFLRGFMTNKDNYFRRKIEAHMDEQVKHGAKTHDDYEDMATKIQKVYRGHLFRNKDEMSPRENLFQSFYTFIKSLRTAIMESIPNSTTIVTDQSFWEFVAKKITQMHTEKMAAQQMLAIKNVVTPDQKQGNKLDELILVGKNLDPSFDKTTTSSEDNSSKNDNSSLPVDEKRSEEEEGEDDNDRELTESENGDDNDGESTESEKESEDDDKIDFDDKFHEHKRILEKHSTKNTPFVAPRFNDNGQYRLLVKDAVGYQLMKSDWRFQTVPYYFNPGEAWKEVSRRQIIWMANFIMTISAFEVDFFLKAQGRTHLHILHHPIGPENTFHKENELIFCQELAKKTQIFEGVNGIHSSKRNSTATFLSEDERKACQNHIIGQALSWLPGSIDIDHYLRILRTMCFISRKAAPNDVASINSLLSKGHTKKNAWLTKQCCDFIKKLLPDASYGQEYYDRNYEEDRSDEESSEDERLEEDEQENTVENNSRRKSTRDAAKRANWKIVRSELSDLMDRYDSAETSFGECHKAGTRPSIENLKIMREYFTTMKNTLKEIRNIFDISNQNEKAIHDEWFKRFQETERIWKSMV